MEIIQVIYLDNELRDTQLCIFLLCPAVCQQGRMVLAMQWMGRKGRGAWEQGYDVVFKVDQSFQLPLESSYTVQLALCASGSSGSKWRAQAAPQRKNMNIKEIQ